MEYSQQYARYLALNEQALHRLFPVLFMEDSRVAKAAWYSLTAGGKRVRGVLTLAACDLVSQETKQAENYSAAVEMLHCYSLIHDDLPCMDNAATRRGKASCHIAFGEAQALLAGDALLTAAFAALTLDDALAVQNAKAVRLLSEAAGPRGMVYGQELDLAAENKPFLSEEELTLLQAHKTGCLIRAAVSLGAVAGGASAAECAALDRFAGSLGLVFQIVDDILDVTASAEEFGKPVGSDADNGKTTFVSLKGVEAARKTAETLTAGAVASLRDVFGERAAFLQQMAEAMLNRKK